MSTGPSGRAVRGAVMGSCAMVLLGASVAVSSTLVHAPLLMVQAIRYAMAVPVLAIMAKAGGARIVRPRGTEWLWLAGVAAIGLALFNVAVMRGVAHAEPAAVAVAVACVPVLLGILAPAMERTWPRARILAAALVVTTGSILVEGGGQTDAVGVLWVVVALVCEAAFTLLAIPVLHRHGAWGVSFHSVWMATVLLAAMGLATGEAPEVGGLTAADYGAIVYLAVMATATTFVLWYSATAMLGADRVGLLTGISPVAAAATGILTSSQVPNPVVFLGILVVVCGLLIGLATPRKPASRLFRSSRSADVPVHPDPSRSQVFGSPPDR